MKKEIVGYTEVNPYKKGVTHVALWLQVDLSYVFATYSGADKFPKTLPNAVALLPIKAAKEIYKFKKRTLEERVKLLKQKARKDAEDEAYARGVARAEYNRGWEETFRRAAEDWDDKHEKGSWASGW